VDRNKIKISKGLEEIQDSEFLVLKPESPQVTFSHPHLASGSDGEVWIVWSAAQYGYQSVLLRRLDKSGSRTLIVDDGSGVNRDPRISVDSRGYVWIVYESLQSNPENDRKPREEKNNPVYILDRGFVVENPSSVLRITDGVKWWGTKESHDPALGLMPNVFCSSEGTVWLLSSSFRGYSRPYRDFVPLCESLGPRGWHNHGTPFLEEHNYKTLLPLAESPDGRVWTVWTQHHRKKTGISDTPSWTLLDAEDAFGVAPMPNHPESGYPELIPFNKEIGSSQEKAGHSFPKEHPSPPLDLALPTYRTEYNGETLTVYFGDLHQHSEFSTCGLWNGRVDQNQHYTRFVRDLDFMCTIDHAEHLNDHNWHTLQLAAQKYYQPGEFVPFTGFEWTSEFDGGGNLYCGHYNALFRDVGIGDYYFSASDPRYNTPLKLWNALKKSVRSENNVLTFAHHTSRRMAWLSWNFYDPDMAPLIEIAQSRGSYEYEGCFSDQILHNDCTRVRGHYIHDGLERGMRWGFVASGDHGGRQLAAVFAPKLDRDSLFDSMRARRTYATNGERMFMDCRVNGHFMGEEFELEDETRTIFLKVIGTTPLIEVDLFRNGRIIKQWNIKTHNFEQEWVDREPLFQRENYYYMRAFQDDGGQAWSSPIWVIDPKLPGGFHFQVGGDELRVIYPGQETDVSVLMHNAKSEPVSGIVHLKVPDGWKVQEKDGIPVECDPGVWTHAVFHVTASESSVPNLCLPEVMARFDSSDGRRIESPLFVVGSPTPLTREEKAVLIDARTELPQENFKDFLDRMGEIWREESR
jgi:hypothetical protein